MKLRMTDIADASLVARLERGVPEFRSKYSAKDVRTRLCTQDHFIVIPELKGIGPVGYYVCHYKSDVPEGMYLWLAGILPKHREKGIHRQAMRACEDKTKELGYSSLWLKTFSNFYMMLESLPKLGFNQFNMSDSSQGELHYQKEL